MTPRVQTLSPIIATVAGFGIIMSGINMERINQHDKAVDTLDLQVKNANLVNQEQSEI